MEKDKRLRGLQDRALELDASGVDDIIERTEVAQQGFRGTLFMAETSFTEQEIKKARAEIDNVIFPRHHGKTPLPIPRQ